MPGDPPTDPQGFAFLYRTDRGVIGRATWWRGTIPLAIVGALATVGWLAVSPYTHDAINQPPVLAVLGYVYLLVFAFAVLILFICHYNLSAKRFAARKLPRALAALLPLSALGAGAVAWYVPRSQGELADWTTWLAVACVAAVAVWFMLELGGRTDRVS